MTSKHGIVVLCCATSRDYECYVGKRAYASKHVSERAKSIGQEVGAESGCYRVFVSLEKGHKSRVAGGTGTRLQPLVHVVPSSTASVSVNVIHNRS